MTKCSAKAALQIFLTLFTKSYVTNLSVSSHKYISDLSVAEDVEEVGIARFFVWENHPPVGVAANPWDVSWKQGRDWHGIVEIRSPE